MPVLNFNPFISEVNQTEPVGALKVPYLEITAAQNHVECTGCDVCVCIALPPFEVRRPCWFTVQPVRISAGIHYSCTITLSEWEFVQGGIWEGAQRHGDTVEQGQGGVGEIQEVS